MVDAFLNASLVQLYGSHLSGKTFTITRLCTLLQDSYGRVVVAEQDGRKILPDVLLTPSRFLFVTTPKPLLPLLADHALAGVSNLLVIDDFDAYAPTADERRRAVRELTLLHRNYDKIIICTPTLTALEPHASHALFRLSYAADLEPHVRITHKTKHARADAFVLDLSRRLKLRHLE